MSSGHELTRQVWWIPAELREPIYGVLFDVLAGRHDTSERGRVEGAGFAVSWDGHGRLFVRWGDGGAGRRIMVEGRSYWRGLLDRLEQVEASRREVHGLRLEVGVMPGVEFEFDDDDLGRMTHALGDLYGHRVNARLTRAGEDTRVADGVREIRRLLVDSKNYGTLPQATVDRINQALELARDVQSVLREDG